MRCVFHISMITFDHIIEQLYYSCPCLCQHPCYWFREYWSLSQQFFKHSIVSLQRMHKIFCWRRGILWIATFRKFDQLTNPVREVGDIWAVTVIHNAWIIIMRYCFWKRCHRSSSSEEKRAMIFTLSSAVMLFWNRYKIIANSKLVNKNFKTLSFLRF